MPWHCYHSRDPAASAATLLPTSETPVIFNAFLRFAARLFMPGIAREMAREGQMDFRKQGADREYDLGNYIRVEDNGSDTTIIAFAGMAVLFAGMPQFEFRSILKKAGQGCNLIFVRDTRRAGYCEAPDGTPTGLQFYERIIREALDQLGSKYNIALGASAGGAGAFYVSSRLPIHQIITFSPGFPPEVYFAPATQLHTYFGLWRLIREPMAYFEVLLVTLAGLYIYRRAKQLRGEEGIPDIMGDYLRMKPEPPRATIFYGERCRPDSNQARMFQHVPQIHLRPVPTGRHNCAGVLKHLGTLESSIAEEIEAGLSAWQAGQKDAATA